MWQEFKEFIMRGSVLELAIGLVMGSAFTAIVNALVDSIIMPLVTALTGNASVEDLSIQIGSAIMPYGIFIQAIIDFILIAGILFFVVKGANSLSRRAGLVQEKKDEEKETEPTPTDYLEEIRDLLAEQKELSETHDVPDGTHSNNR